MFLAVNGRWAAPGPRPDDGRDLRALRGEIVRGEAPGGLIEGGLEGFGVLFRLCDLPLDLAHELADLRRRGTRLLFLQMGQVRWAGPDKACVSLPK